MFSTIIAVAMGFSAYAGGWHAEKETIWDVQAKRFISLADLKAKSGEIYVLGEEHAVKENASLPSTFIHHDNQVRWIQKIQDQSRDEAFTVSVGMEFLTYTFQGAVDQFLHGLLPEADFLKQVQWSSNPFEFYRRQILAPRDSGGRTIALNIPVSVAEKVAASGKDSLDAADLALVPPFWERGNDAYFARFAEDMKDHVKPEALERYFWAQSLWDDTMAWKALQHRAQMPEDVLVIIVGGFHTEFGGGLPYELRKKGTAVVKTMMQVEAPDWSDATLQSLIEPDATYGDSADYLWLHYGAVADPAALVF